MEAGEKIKRTRQILLILGKRIDYIAADSEVLLDALWQYVHTVCKTALHGSKLCDFYKRLAAAEEEQDN